MENLVNYYNHREKSSTGVVDNLWKTIEVVEKTEAQTKLSTFPQADFCSICGNVDNFFLIAVVKRDTLFKC